MINVFADSVELLSNKLNQPETDTTLNPTAEKSASMLNPRGWYVWVKVWVSETPNNWHAWIRS